MRAKVGEHLVEVVAAVEAAEDDDLDERAGEGGGGEGGDEREEEVAGGGGGGGGGEGADHVEAAVGEVDEAHDAEDQGQAGGHQEEHGAELEAVQDLLDEEGRGHWGSLRGARGAQSW